MKKFISIWMDGWMDGWMHFEPLGYGKSGRNFEMICCESTVVRSTRHYSSPAGTLIALNF